jgi:general secretion pathway protein F
MPIFKYRGYKAGGAEATGTIEAEGLRDAAAKIKALGLFPRAIDPVEERGRRWWMPGRRTDKAALPQLTRQLSVLLASGVPLVEAIKAVSRESRGSWKNVLVDVREKVAAGASLARSMEEHRDFFPESYINLVAAGEQSGNLDDVFMKLADFLEGQQSMKDKVDVAMIYPVFMIGVVGVVLILLFTYVVPKIVTIFEQSKAALPLPTVILIGLSDLCTTYWWALLAGVAAAIYFGKRFMKLHRLKVDRLLLKMLPSLYLSRFSRTLGFLLAGGVPMLRALELSGRASGNSVLEHIVKTAEGRVSEGARLSAALEGLPPVMLELVATGERSGQLTNVLERAAVSYEAEFDRRVQRFLATLEPSMILFMGLIVGFVVFAILLPMFELNQLIK